MGLSSSSTQAILPVVEVAARPVTERPLRFRTGKEGGNTIRHAFVAENHPSSSMPPIDDDPEYLRLYESAEHAAIHDVMCLVEHCQMHICTATCVKYGKPNECRFRYPKPLSEKAHIADNGRLVLQRNHPRVNGYNPTILRCIRCNMDIRLIFSGHDAKSSFAYLYAYCTKRKLKLDRVYEIFLEIMKKVEAAAPSHCSGQGWQTASKALLTKLLNQLCTRVERSGQFCSHLVMGRKEVYASHTFARCNLWPYLSRLNKYDLGELLDVGEYEDGEDHPDDDAGTGEAAAIRGRGNTLHLLPPRTHYEYRSMEEPIHSMSLYEFTELVETISAPKPTSVPKSGRTLYPMHINHPFASMYRQCLRSVPKIAVLSGGMRPSPRSDRVAFSRWEMLVFTPFRECTSLRPLGSDWVTVCAEAKLSERCQQVSRNQEELSEGIDQQRLQQAAFREQNEMIANDSLVQSSRAPVPGGNFDIGANDDEDDDDDLDAIGLDGQGPGRVTSETTYVRPLPTATASDGFAIQTVSAAIVGGLIAGDFADSGIDRQLYHTARSLHPGHSDWKHCMDTQIDQVPLFSHPLQLCILPEHI